MILLHMIKSKLSKIAPILIAITTLQPVTAFAALGTGIDVPGQGISKATSYAQYIGNIYNFAIKLGGILAVLMIIYAGIRYMTSQGNPSAINEAKDILIGSLSGFALLLLIYLILNLLGLPTVIN